MNAVASRGFSLERHLLDALATEVKGFAGAVLRSAGYHQHARGAWRLSRNRGQTMSDQATANVPRTGEILLKMKEIASEAKSSRRLAGQYLDLHLSLNLGSEAELLGMLREDPVRVVEECYLARLEPGHQVLREALRRHVARFREGLLADGDSAIERAIVDRGVACWLAVHDAERHLARLREKGEVPRVSDHKRLDHAQKRLLDVLKALDQVRKKTPAAHRLKVIVQGDAHLSIPSEVSEPPVVIDLLPRAIGGEAP